MSAFWWALLAAFIWGATAVIEKYVLLKIDPLPGLFFRCLGVLIGAVLLGAIMLKPAQIKAVDLRSATLFVTVGFLGSFVAFIAFYKALKVGEISLVVPVAGSFYLLAFFMGIFLLKETVSVLKVAGVVFITLGIWMLGSSVAGK